MRIDGVAVPPGLIASGKTYTLILEDDGLYVLHTGPAGRDVRTRGLAEYAAVSMVRSAQAKKIAAGEARIDDTPLDELVKEKHSKFVRKDEIESLQLNKGMPPVLKFVSQQGKYKFHFTATPREVVEEFVEKLQS